MLGIADYVRTVRLVNQYGYDGAALSDGVCRHAIKKRINRLESKLGFKVFTGYQFDRITYQGREWLKQHDEN